MKYYFFIIGCAMNYSDAERLAAELEAAGWEKARSEEEADLLVAVSCSVRQSAVDRIYDRGRKWAGQSDKKTALTGCVLDSDRRKLRKKFDYVFDISEMEAFVREVSLKKKKKTPQSDYLLIRPRYESSFRAYVPIMTGCDNFCSYCAVPYVRGRERSRPKAAVVSEVRDLVKERYKEITLLGQNVNSYEAPGGFVGLLREIDGIEGDFWAYFYSNHPKDVSGELLETLPKLKHFSAYFHLPLQSGSDGVLKKMNRRYTQKDYHRLVERIREALPSVALTTDVMVGFCGETEEQFKETEKVMKEIAFDMAFISRYSPRPGTAGAKEPDTVSGEEKKRRQKKLQKILTRTSLENNRKLKGKTVRVLVDSEKGGKYYGRTDSRKVVAIKTDRLLEIGRFYEVRIEKAEAWKLTATLS